MAINTNTVVYGALNSNVNKNRVKSEKSATYGFAYPIVRSGKSGGYFSKSSGLELVSAQIKQLLNTGRRERLMLPDFGADLKKYVFDPLDNTLVENIKRDINVSFERYMPNVEVQNLDIFSYNDNAVNIRLVLKILEEDGILVEVPITL